MEDLRLTISSTTRAVADWGSTASRGVKSESKSLAAEH